jgi:aromatic-L-amino-acid/L-tryptophan decarboxylase
VTHPRYFGLYNPSVRDVAVAADALVSAWNPQLAAWPHAPAAVEMEQRALTALGAYSAFPPETAASFTTGGAEANLQAILAALAARAPAWDEGGLAALPAPAVVYASEGSHLSTRSSRSRAPPGWARLRSGSSPSRRS